MLPVTPVLTPGDVDLDRGDGSSSSVVVVGVVVGAAVLLIGVGTFAVQYCIFVLYCGTVLLWRRQRVSNENQRDVEQELEDLQAYARMEGTAVAQ